jgi:hypothetical protein
MRWFWFPFGALALLAVALVRPGAAQPPLPKGDTTADADALRKAGLSGDDGPALVGYLKQRTVSDADQERIRELIKKFAARRFEERMAASDEVMKYGPAAIGPLKDAERSADPEVAYRAGLALKKLEQVPHPAVAIAAIRRVAALKPPGAAAALIGFLPLADNDTQADEIRQALIDLAAPGGKPDSALVAALSDPSPVRRSAAYVALTEGGPPAERIRIPAAFPLVRDAVRRESDAEARFVGLWALVLTTREKQFVPDLIALTPILSHNRLRQVEELLLHVAGSHPPGGRFGRTPELRTKARDAWAAWWGQKGGAVDLVRFPFVPKVHGYTEVVEQDLRYGLGRVVALGPDMKMKWQLPQVNNAADARILPSGRVLVAEQNSFRVAEWNPLTGESGGARATLTQPIVAVPLADGGTLIVCRGSVGEYDKAGVRVFEYFRPTADIQSGARLPNGDTLVVTLQPQAGAPNGLRLDRKGKEIGKPMVLGPVVDAHAMDVVGEDHVLVCETTQVAEYDLKTAKLVWQHVSTRPTGVQRLPNGNTVIANLNQNTAVEVDPAGEVVWEYAAKDDMRVSRLCHR